ncbi:hypothetical protein J4E80_006225 [Alternaria sp. BMP 0032]|nr:hypothetical protein J4E80_006225 [Alternaria sp. BMP 0032]
MAIVSNLSPTSTFLFSGTRCRTCAQVIPDDRTGFCAAHDERASSCEAILGRWCCELQQKLEHKQRGRWVAQGKPLPSLGGEATASEDALWQRANLLALWCEMSLVELEADLEFGLQKHDWIANIEELKYDMGEQVGHLLHCAFKITLENKKTFVFDPTGIQFGAEWAVLTPWDEYVLDRETELTIQDQVRLQRQTGEMLHQVVRPLGRNADWQILEKWQGQY